MSQGSVLKFLEKHRGKKFTSKEIAEKLKAQSNSVTASIKRLKKFGEINHKQAEWGNNHLYWIN